VTVCISAFEKHQRTSEVNMLGSCTEGHKMKSYLNKTVLLSAHA